MAERFSKQFVASRTPCWSSQWRPAGMDKKGRPTHFIHISLDELAILASTGKLRIPDTQLPEALRGSHLMAEGHEAAVLEHA